MIRHSISILLLAVCAVACDSSDKFAGEVAVVNYGAETEIALPAILRTVSALDPSALQLQVTVNNGPTSLEKGDDDIWRGTVNVPVNQSHEIAVQWGMDYGSSGYLKLAEQRRFVFVGTEETNVVFDGGYTTSFDNDGDGRTNLAEVEQSRSPVDRNDVYINAGGTFPQGVSYPASGVCGQKNPINVLVRGVESDPETDIWWCARLESTLIDSDGNQQNIENLQITVYVEDEILFVDGSSVSETQFYHDDSIEIFIDGDNNKRGPYDGINDFQFRYVPIGEGQFNMARGPGSFSAANFTSRFDYFTGGYILTATIPLQEVGIRKSFEFGINVEVNDDDDGGDRDAKYSWVAAEGVDNAYSNTQLFGTGQVD